MRSASLPSLLIGLIISIAGLAFAGKKWNPDRRPPVIWPPPLIAPSHNIVFTWCRKYNTTGECGSRVMKHGVCHDLPTFGDNVKGSLEGVGAAFGHCMLYQGAHTIMFMGEHLWTKGLCPFAKKRIWIQDASSVRCCAGHPENPWCTRDDLYGKRLERPRCEENGIR
ncbi:hypothetical protein PT974_07282 [Cladobotryum mycophilum]|uniref:Uncharacterized protein n=1 Tax=Cladobotryum mycophilum TaxID=491253 RepID=A0ABR0SQ53_9HYPO